MGQTTSPSVGTARAWRRGWVGPLTFAAVALAGFAGTTWLDGPAHRALADYRQVVNREMHQMLSSIGSAPLWLALVACMMLIERRPGGRRLPDRAVRPARRGLILLITGLAAGGANYILKVLFRRLRPPELSAWNGQYLWRPWTDRPLSASGLGLPSGHATLAFACMFLLCRLYPRAWPVFVLLAAGCGFTRIVGQSHFVSDVWASAVVGWIAAWVVWRATPSWRGA